MTQEKTLIHKTFKREHSALQDDSFFYISSQGIHTKFLAAINLLEIRSSDKIDGIFFYKSHNCLSRDFRGIALVFVVFLYVALITNRFQ